MKGNPDYCRTRYPVLLLHGLNFQDHRPMPYWGRVPHLLRALGAQVYFGGQDACGSLWDNGSQVASRIRRITACTGCEKVNIIAHSKGGLEARYAASVCGVGDAVASITTISTPHRGCKTVSGYLSRPKTRLAQAVVYGENWYGRILGDQYPDFAKAVSSLSVRAAERLNRLCPDVPGILYQSWGVELNSCREDWLMGAFQRLFWLLDGETDGFVTPASARWGEYRGTLWKISHQQVTGCRRRPGRYFDPERFYISLVHELKEKGL